MKSKSEWILTSVKLWFLLPLPCKITVFTAQNPSKNETKSLQKHTLQPDPPKIVSFPSRATLDGIMNRKGFQKGPQNRASRAANFLWKSMIFGVPPPHLPKSPKASISEVLLINFESFLTVSNAFFFRLVSVLSAPAPPMIRNDSITVWRTSIPWRNRPWATISKPKKHKANSSSKRIKILPRKLTVFWNVPILCRMLRLWEYQEIFGMLRFASECQSWT